MALFTVRDLTFTYPDGKRPALTRLNFSVDQGDFVLICGKSGCGKTTLLRHFKTALSPYGVRSGGVSYFGTALFDVDVRTQSAEIGYVLQSPDNQIVTDKVWHELAFGVENLGYDQQTIRLRVAEMASFFGIQNWFHKRVEELSGGQKQLLNLASVMVMQPKVLVLDEPTSQLDPIAAGEFLSTLRKINTELGTTMIIIEHRLEEVFPMADKVLVLEDGSQLLFDTPRTVGTALAGNDLFAAMPGAVQIYVGSGKRGECPLNVCEGRSFLEREYGGGKGDARCHRGNGGSFPEQKYDPYKSERAAQASAFSTADRRHQTADERQMVNPRTKRLDKTGSKEDYMIEAKEVYFRYEKELPDVVKGLSLSVRRGELYAILGGNGTGKTTTLSLIAGIRRPYRGRILLDHKDITKIRDKERFRSFLGVLSQNPQSLFVEDTVEKDLWEMVGGRLLHGKEYEERMERVIADTEISHLLAMHPYDLSGGEQQRAALAKILLLDPKLLLLDEPTKGLDGFYKQKLARILAHLKKRGVTILMVSHDIEFCAAYADTCALFFDGDIVSSGPPAAFFTGNSFYTTAANRMARDIFPDAVTVKDVIDACKSIRWPA